MDRYDMTPAYKFMLLRRVLEKAYIETETWWDGDIGLSLAYLAHAVTRPQQEQAFVTWVEYCRNTGAALAIFRSLFEAGDEIWQFIHVEEEE